MKHESLNDFHGVPLYLRFINWFGKFGGYHLAVSFDQADGIPTVEVFSSSRTSFTRFVAGKLGNGLFHLSNKLQRFSSGRTKRK